MAIFVLQSFLFFLLGFFDKKKSFGLFVFLILSLPYSAAFSKYTFLFGIVPYLFYFLGDLIANLAIRKINVNSLVIYFLILIIIHSGIPFSSLFFDWKTYLKDLFPVFVIIVFHLWSFKNFPPIKKFEKTIKYIVVINFIIALIFILIKDGVLDYFSITDKYYVAQFRYINLFIYLSPIFIYFRRLFTLNLLYLTLIFSCLLMSGSRTILFVSIISLALSMKRNSALIKLSFGICALFSGIYFYENLSLLRPLSFLNYELINSDLTTRFSPFFMALSEFKLHNYIIGNGAGYGFYIPWFEYRENVNNYNVDLDNFYFTVFGKYGLLSIPLGWLIYLQIKTLFINRIVLLALIYLIISYGFTNSFIYQIHFSGVLFFMIFLDRIITTISDPYA